MDLGIFSSPRTIDGLTAAARSAAEDGFASYWTSQVFGLDALTAIAVAARQVDGIRFGTGVVPIQPRHPMMLAGQALTVSQASGGQLDLGIGLSHQFVVEHLWGLPFNRPVRHMREYLEALQPLLRGESGDTHGEIVTSVGAIDIDDAVPPQVLVAALGEQMLKVTGRLAGGTITWCTGPKTLRSHIVPTITAAAEAAGRSAPRIVAGLPIVLTDDVDSAKAFVAKTTQGYAQLPSYRAMLDREGVEGPANVAIVGDESAVGEALTRLGEAGATDLLSIPFAVEGDRDAVARTRDLLSRLARRP